MPARATVPAARRRATVPAARRRGATRGKSQRTVPVASPAGVV